MEIDYLDLVLRWVHILAAAVLVGGAFFWKFVWQPVAAQMDDPTRGKVFEAMRGRWSQLLMTGIALLLITGLLNAVRIIQQYRFVSAPNPQFYHILVSVKLALALLLFYIASRLAGRSESAKRFREGGTWLTVNVVLAVLIVCYAGYMKYVPREKKLDASQVAMTTISDAPAADEGSSRSVPK